MLLINKEAVLAPERGDVTAECTTKSFASANKNANLCVYALLGSVLGLRDGAADNRNRCWENTGGQVHERLLSDVKPTFPLAFDRYITLLNPMIV